MQLSIYDLNMWFYDDVLPEYFLTIQDAHLETASGALRAWGYKLPKMFWFYFVLGTFLALTKQKLVGGTSVDFEKSFLVKRMQKTVKERFGSRRHFLNLSRALFGTGINKL